MLSPSIAERWSQQARAQASTLRSHGVAHASHIPDEMARVEADGSLTLYVPLPDGTEISMRVAASDWAWSGPRNQ